MNPKAMTALDREFVRWAEVNCMFAEITEHADDNVPASPCREDFEAVSGAARIEMHAHIARDDQARKDRERHALKKNRSDAIVVEHVTCKGCGNPLDRVRHDRPGRVAEYCKPSCKQKAYRARKARNGSDDAAASEVS
jgi:hypothetical protein